MSSMNMLSPPLRLLVPLAVFLSGVSLVVACGSGGSGGGAGGASAGGGSGNEAGVTGAGGSVIGNTGGQGNETAQGGASAQGGSAGSVCLMGGPGDPVILGGDLEAPEVLPGDIHLKFDNSTDLTQKFFVPAGATDVSVKDGSLQVDYRKYRTLIFDTTPDATPTDSFDDFRVSLRFMANTGSHVPSAGVSSSLVAPAIWVSFFPQQARTDAARVEVLFSETGNDGINFYTGADFAAPTLTTNGKATTTDDIVTMDPMYPSPSFYTLTVAVKRGAQGRATADAIVSQNGRVIMQGRHEFLLAKTSGEIAIGANAVAGSDGKTNPFVIDDIVIHRGAVTVPDLPTPALFTNGTSPDNFKLYLPPGVKPVKGILYHAVGSYMADREYNRRFADLHELALMGGSKDTTTAASIAAAISTLATMSGHAELTTVPLLLYGFSNGTRTALTGIANTPVMRDRILAITSDSLASATYFPKEAWKIPTLIFKGAADEGLESTDKHLQALKTTRSAGGHASFLNRDKLSHSELGAFAVMFPVFNGVIRAIHADGQMPFESINEDAAWLIPNNTWTMATKDPMPMPQIVSAKGYAGVVGETSWLIDKDSAFAAAALVTFNRVVALTRPPFGKAGDDRTVSIRVSQSMLAWTKIELYDGATLVHTVNPCDPMTYTFNAMLKGFHSLVALLYKDDKAYPSYPSPVVIN